jgi:hypothetical protein
MLDRWVVGAIVLLVMVCVFSSSVALSLWLPDRRERARIRAERVEQMLRDVHEAETEMTGDTM